jgi:dienelactone hydrolase
MFESRRRLLVPAVLATLSGLALGGCEASKDGDPFPPAPTETFKADFNTTTGALPYPIDLFFSGSTDGTLNLPIISFRPAAMRDALNSQDGWSTTAPISATFSMPLKASSLTAGSVRVVEMYLSNTTKGPAQGAELPPGVTSPVIRPLTFGTDYTATVSQDVESNGKVLLITPLKPLRPSTGGTNIGYMVILTDSIQNEDGKTVTADTQYANYKSAPADCSNFASTSLDRQLCQLTKGQLQIAGALGVSPTAVVATWSFTTQSVDDVFNYISATTAAKASTVVPTGLTTAAANPAFQGKANIHTGFTTVPYYLVPAPTTTGLASSAADRAAVLGGFWVAAGAPLVPGLDPTSRNLTRFNPVPLNRGDRQIPMLVTVPNSSAAGGNCAKPAAGWPLVIVQHGITGNRTQALAMADSYAEACIVVAAIDLPLHGVVDTTSPLYCSATNPACVGARERTFDLDLVNNSTGAAPPDTRIDSSGAHFINLASPATGRDNLRQAAADMIQLRANVASLDLDMNGSADIDPQRISFTGLSLGAMVGITGYKFAIPAATATFSAPGGLISRWALDSPAFSPSIISGLGAAGLVNNSYLFNLFMRDFQAVLDSGDPVNHIKGTAARQPTHLIAVAGDTVVPNSSTNRLIAAAGMTKLTTLGPNPVAPGTGAYTLFKLGSHGTLFDPTASMPATVEMQTQAVMFAATVPQPGGPFVILTNPAVLDLN